MEHVFNWAYSGVCVGGAARDTHYDTPSFALYALLVGELTGLNVLEFLKLFDAPFSKQTASRLINVLHS